MRTKKALSVFFAVLMTLSVFGVINASAERAKGWEGVKNGFSFEYAATGNAERKEVYWETFSAGDGSPASPSFWSMVTDNSISARVTVAHVKTGGNDVLINNVDATGASVTANDITVFPEKTANKITVILKPGANERYGEFIVTLTLTVGSEVKTGTCSVWLIDEGEYKKALEKAEDMAKQDDRYDEAFIKKLNAAIKEAKQLVGVSNPDPSRYTAATDLLKKAVENPTYILSGWDWLDDWLGSFLNFKDIWGFIDGVADFFSFIGKISDFFGQVGDFWNKYFGWLDFGAIFGGLWSLIVSIFALIPGI